MRRSREVLPERVSVEALAVNQEPIDLSGTPEELAALEQTTAALCRAVGGGRYAYDCLTALLAGASVAETANQLGISASYVKKLRAELRQAAAALWGKS
jgi:Tfp pilus assembly protein PilN